MLNTKSYWITVAIAVALLFLFGRYKLIAEDGNIYRLNRVTGEMHTIYRSTIRAVEPRGPVPPKNGQTIIEPEGF